MKKIILSIIIPVFNEERTVKALLKKVIMVKLPTEFQKDITVIDDGSTDKSKRIIQNSKLKELRLISHRKNQGKGAAVRTGIREAKGDYILIQDADLEYDPKDYVNLLNPILKNKAEIVYGTRLINYPLRLWGKNKTILPIHLVANKFLTGLINFLYGSNLTDMETCYKVFHNSVIKKINLKSNRFEFEPEITIKAIKLGYKIVEVPIEIKPRGYKEGKKIGFIDGIQAVLTIFRYLFSA